MLHIFSQFGLHIYVALMVSILLFLLFNATFTWRCGICGKMNETGYIKMILCWCDHMGLF